MSDYYNNVRDYFAAKADNYDDVDSQRYWVFSDNFYKEVLKRELFNDLKDKTEIRLLDAGAGTGRWTVFFYELFSQHATIAGTLIDISPDMLSVAEQKMEEKQYGNRFTCQVGNIEDLGEMANEPYDVALSFYNVLSFVEHPEKAVREIYRALKPGGVYAAVVGNSYHAYYFALLTGRLKELDRVSQESKIAFNDAMPAMHCFTPQALKDLCGDAGFSSVEVVGGPNFLYPGMEETKVHGATDALQTLLEDESLAKKLMDIELAHYRDEEIAGRANTLLVLARK